MRLRRLPVAFQYSQGRYVVIGPRAVSPGELSPRDRLPAGAIDVRPGLFCLWWVRRRANIAYGYEALSDVEYVESQSLIGDLALALRAIPAVMYGEAVAAAPDEFTLGGIRIHNLTMPEAIETLVAWGRGATQHQVAFVNADCANIAWRDPSYTAVLNRSALTLGDGIGIKVAAKALGLQLKQNVNGTDLFPRLCEALAGEAGGLFTFSAPGRASRRQWRSG